MKTSWRSLFFLCLWCASCGPCSAAVDAPDPGRVPDPTTARDCDRLGYVCSLGEQGLDAFDLQKQAYELLAERLSWGASEAETAEAAEALRAMPGMRRVDVNGTTIIFEVEGGMPAWYMDPYAEIDDIVLPPEATGEGALSMLRGFVGSYDEATGQAKPKKALIVAPYAWQWGEWSYHKRFASYLESSPGFGTVDVITNGAVDLASFDSWPQYDFIGIHTHGGVGTSQGPYEGLVGLMLTRGQRESELENDPTGTNLDDFFETLREDRATLPLGVSMSCTPIHIIRGWNDVTKHKDYWSLPARDKQVCGYLLTPDFFRFSSQAHDLTDTLVYLHACDAMGNNTLARALAGANSAVLGWRDTIQGNSNVTLAAVQFLHAKLLRDGFGVQETVDLMRRVGFDEVPNGRKNQEKARLEYFLRGGAGTPASSQDLRPIDFIRLSDEIATRSAGVSQELSHGAGLGFEGTAGDGEADTLAMRVELQGQNLTPPAGISSLWGTSEAQGVLEIRHDGEVLFSSRRDTFMLENQEDHRAEVVIPEVDLGFDVPKEGRAITLELHFEHQRYGTWTKTYKDLRLEGGGGCSWEIRTQGKTFRGDEVGYQAMPGGAFSMLLLSPNPALGGAINLEMPVASGMLGVFPGIVSLTATPDAYYAHQDEQGFSVRVTFETHTEEEILLRLGGTWTEALSGQVVGLEGDVRFERGSCDR